MHKNTKTKAETASEISPESAQVEEENTGLMLFNGHCFQ